MVSGQCRISRERADIPGAIIIGVRLARVRRNYGTTKTAGVFGRLDIFLIPTLDFTYSSKKRYYPGSQNFTSAWTFVRYGSNNGFFLEGAPPFYLVLGAIFASSGAASEIRKSPSSPVGRRDGNSFFLFLLSN